jgi:hypothetical protein
MNIKIKGNDIFDREVKITLETIDSEDSSVKYVRIRVYRKKSECRRLKEYIDVSMLKEGFKVEVAEK